MDKTFNELFNEFFNDYHRQAITPKIDDIAKERAKKMIDILTKFRESTDITEETEQEMDAKLGKPDKIEFFNEGNVFFERRIWHTEGGNIEKLIMTDDPTMLKPPVIEKTLQQQLDEAVEKEDFEKAAGIRDEMKKRKKLQKKVK